MMTRAGGGEVSEPTLVMGASIVMEWILAMEECLRWELPKNNNNNNIRPINTYCKHTRCSQAAKKQPEFPSTNSLWFSPSLPRDVVDLTSREPFLRSLCLQDWMSGERESEREKTHLKSTTWKTNKHSSANDKANDGHGPNILGPKDSKDFGLKRPESISVSLSVQPGCEQNFLTCGS